MANLALILDPDPQVRSHIAAKLQVSIAPVDGLTVAVHHCRELTAVWAVSPSAPVSVATEMNKLSVIWGEAIAADSAERITAEALAQAWQTLPGQPYDGFYAAATYTPEQGLKVGADVLGFFPLYYGTVNGSILVTSSPELFRYHPGFTPQLSLEGVAGVLLMKGLVNDQPLWQGIRRLGAGSLLSISPHRHSQEIPQYRVPSFRHDIEKAGYHQLPFPEQVDVLAAALEQAVARHAPDADQTLLLSGGLDSRTLAGYLSRQHHRPTTLTFGRPDDLESQCAATVARHLGLSHQTYEPPITAYANYAHWVTTWEHLVGGGNGLTGSGWSSLAPLQGLPARVITGLTMDRVICGIRLRQPSFAASIQREYRKALDPRCLGRLLNGGEAAVAAVVEELRQRYQGYSDLETHRAWLLSLYHANRMSLGTYAWRMSFGAWPRIPVLDQRLIAVSAQLPSESTSQRRAQKAMVKAWFPDLARLPLDHNDFDIQPLSPSSWQKRLQPLFRVRKLGWKVQSKLGRERRYYYRMFDINHPGLRQVRRQANAYRDALSPQFNRAYFDQLLPPTETLALERDPIQETKRYLVLLALLLWAGKNL